MGLRNVPKNAGGEYFYVNHELNRIHQISIFDNYRK